MSDFKHLREAVLEYDRTASVRDKVWDLIDTDEQMMKAIASDAAATYKLGFALYQDTSDYNTLENCLLIGIDTARSILKQGNVSSP